MKAYLPDGTIISGNMAGNCTGYVAERIELEPRDCDELIRLAHSGDLFAVLKQLQMRFPESRAKSTT